MYTTSNRIKPIIKTEGFPNTESLLFLYAQQWVLYLFFSFVNPHDLGYFQAFGFA